MLKSHDRSLLEHGAREGLPVLEWTISHTGAQVTGRCYTQPGTARRAALAAWAAALGIRLGEEISPGQQDDHHHRHG